LDSYQNIRKELWCLQATQNSSSNYGDLNFHSDSYEWLVVNKESERAQYKGTGTINGSGQYKFMIWATDNGSGSDTFRIKICNALDEDEVIYDNGSDQTIGGGQISVIVK